MCNSYVWYRRIKWYRRVLTYKHGETKHPRVLNVYRETYGYWEGTVGAGGSKKR
jgi:hypothetical protein